MHDLDGRRDERARPISLNLLLGAQPPLPRLHALNILVARHHARSSRVSRCTGRMSRRDRSRSARVTARYIDRAVDEAKRRNPATAVEVFHFVCGRAPQACGLHPGAGSATNTSGSPASSSRSTIPVTAKGVEDTAFYVYNRLVSLNEVGGDPTVRLVARRRPRLPRGPTGPVPVGLSTGPRTTPSAARTCGRASTCCPSCPASGRPRAGRWARTEPPAPERLRGPPRRPQRRVPAVPDARRRVARERREDSGASPRRVKQYMTRRRTRRRCHTSWINPDPDYDAAVQRVRTAGCSTLRAGPPFLHAFLPFSADVRQNSGFTTASPRRSSGSPRPGCRTSTRELSAGT